MKTKINLTAIAIIAVFMLTWILPRSINAQSITSSEQFKGKTYLKKNTKWHLQDSTGELYEVNGKVITLKFKDSVNQNAVSNFEAANNLQFLRKSKSGWCDYQFTVTDIDSLFVIVRRINNNPIVDKVEITAFGEFHAVPNDTYYNPYQWYFCESCQSPDINIEIVWELLSTGDPNIIVAVIDAGLNFSHEDIGKGNDNYENVFKNPGEDAWSPDPLDPSGGDGQDGTDQNGYVDDWIGWDFNGNDNDVRNFNNFGHGTRVAGIIGAKTNNSLGISGVAGGWNNEGVKILPINVATNANIVNESVLDDAIDYAVDMGVDIIQLAMSIPGNNSTAIEAAIDNAVDNGVVVFCSAGNNGDPNINYPANYKNVISVNALNASDTKYFDSNYGMLLDLAAPGTNIYTTEAGNALGLIYEYVYGTSFSTPMVSGVAALMKSVNPCLSHYQVKDILNACADKVGGYNYSPAYSNKPFHCNETGFGKVDAFMSVATANTIKSNDLDLYIKDYYHDVGLTNAGSPPFDNSPDIWVRNNADGFVNQQHEKLIHTPDDHIGYVYVRIRNKSCVTSQNMDLSVYWNNALTNPSYPAGWTLMNNQAYAIPQIAPGGTEIIEIEWDFSQSVSINGASLLAMMNGIDDPLSAPTSLSYWIEVDNNMAMKNLSVVFLSYGGTSWNGIDVPPGAPLYVCNDDEESYKEYNIFFGHTVQNNAEIMDQAEINIYVEDEFWDMVENSPEIDFNGIEQISDNQFRITEEDASINNLYFQPGSSTQIYAGFNFYGEEAEEDDNILYYAISQFESSEEEWRGTMSFEIVKEARERFEADGGGYTSVFHGGKTVLNGNKINEPAHYNWYRLNDSLLSDTDTVSVKPETSGKYIYEITAKSDGYKDYDTIFVEVKHFSITSLAPNPATSFLNVSYQAEKATTAQLVIQMTANPQVKYVYYVNPNSTVFSINVSNLQTGIYNINLICDGRQEDTKKIIIH